MGDMHDAIWASSEGASNEDQEVLRLEITNIAQFPHQHVSRWRALLSGLTWLAQPPTRQKSARLLALLGAALFAYGSWAPWALVRGQTGLSPESRTYRLFLAPESIGAPPLSLIFSVRAAFIVWSVLSVLGVLLCPLAWVPAPRVLVRFASPAFGVWALLMSLVTLASAHVLSPVFAATFPVPSTVALNLGRNDTVHLYIVSRATRYGLWLALIAVVLCLGAMTLWITGGTGKPSETSSAGSYAVTKPRWCQLSGSLVLTLSIVAWGVGFLVMPWDVLRCPSAGIGNRACLEGVRTLAANVVLSTGLERIAVDPVAAQIAIPALLGGGALLVLAAIWQRDLGFTVLAWVAVWLVSAAGVAAVGYQGLNVQSASSAGSSVSPGYVVTAASLFAGWIGLILLAMPLWRYKGHQSIHVSHTI